MRIKVNLTAPKLPILYRHRFMAMIKEALENSDATYKRSLYPDKGPERSKIVKPFCFNVSMPPGRRAERERIVIDEGVEIEDTVFYFPQNSYLSFYLSSSDYEFMIHLYNGLLELKTFRFNSDIIFNLHRVFMLNEKRINNEEVTFKTNAPILIEDKEGKPIIPIDSVTPIEPSNFQPLALSLKPFNGHFNAIHDRIIRDIRDGQGLYREIEFIPVKLKKQVVKHTLKGFREKTGKPYMTLTCFEGCFKLKGDPRDLQMLYQIGIGLRTGQGFGMVEVV